MEKIWAPWRMEYIASEPKDCCFLCEARDNLIERDALVLKHSEGAFLMLNRYPYANGHLLVVPDSHVGELGNLNINELPPIFELIYNGVGALKEVLCAQGFNIGLNLGRCAGAGVTDHIHIHIVPRWSGDTNFMPILADTKVMNEHLLETYDKLKQYFK